MEDLKFLKQFRISKPLAKLTDAVPEEQHDLIQAVIDGFAAILKQHKDVADQYHRLHREERLFSALLERELKKYLCRADDETQQYHAGY